MWRRLHEDVSDDDDRLIYTRMGSGEAKAVPGSSSQWQDNKKLCVNMKITPSNKYVGSLYNTRNIIIYRSISRDSSLKII